MTTERKLSDTESALIVAIEDLREQVRAHVKFNVRKHYRLMIADVAADNAIRKAREAAPRSAN